MDLAADSLLVVLITGAVAGWLAGLVMKGSGYGIVGDVVVGLLGALVGSYVIYMLKVPVHVGHPLLDKVVVAFIGAMLLLFVIGFFRPRALGERLPDLFRRRW